MQTIADMRATIRARAAALAELDGQHLPEATPDLRRQAEQAAAGILVCTDGTPIEVGLRDIDWSAGHYRHREWGCVLHRFSYLPPLAAAYRDTGDERFARAARGYIGDWIRDADTQPREAHIFFGSLNAALRLGGISHPGWGGCLPVFLDSPAFDDEFLAALLESVRAQTDYVAEHLTASASNIRIAELDCLLMAALRFPFLPNVGRILPIGAEGLGNTLAREFYPDGAHWEMTLIYAVHLTLILANALRLARRFPDLGLCVAPDKVEKAFAFIVQNEAYAHNDYRLPSLQAPDVSLLKRAQSVLASLRPERRRAPPPAIQPWTPPLDQVFPVAGLAFSRTAWTPEAECLGFDASRWGMWHCHTSRLAFAFNKGRRQLVADPGSFTYDVNDPFMSYGKNTPSHSTININGYTQSMAAAHLLHAEFSPRTTFLHGLYDGGYWPGKHTWGFKEGLGAGVFGFHERVLFWVKNEYLLVLDKVSRAEDKGDIRNALQMGPMDRWTMDTEQLAWESRNTDVNVFLQMVAPPEKVTMECVEGRENPPCGWVAYGADQRAPAPRVEFRYPSNTGTHLSILLLVPYAGANRPDIRPQRNEPARVAHNQIINHYIELRRPDGGLDCVGWSPDFCVALDRGIPLSSDAPFVWLRLDPAGAPREVFIFDGHYVTRDSRRLIAWPEHRTGWFSLGNEFK